MMNLFTIDPQKCNQDGLCVQACPTTVIQMNSPDDMPTPTADFEQYCLACGHCVAVCPTGAFNLSWLDSDDCPPVRKELNLSPEQAEHFLRSRRSIRNYKDQPVERRLLEKLLEIAGYASSARNMQPWHWTVVANPAETRRLAGMVIDWMRSVMRRDPASAERRGYPRVVAAWESGQERICRGAPHVIVAHGDKNWDFGAEDCALALSYLELFA
ncbi:MAG: nitroreductase family protein, partial [Desulfobacterales bacterium]